MRNVSWGAHSHLINSWEGGDIAAPIDTAGQRSDRDRAARAFVAALSEEVLRARDADARRGQPERVAARAATRERLDPLRPYNDKTLMRNALAYETARRLGRYASRTRYVELVLNGRYEGVYVLMETPKLDDERVRVADRGLSGGYLLEFTFADQVRGGRSSFRLPTTRRAVVFQDPDAEDLSRRERAWITRHLRRAERALYGRRFRSPTRGWRAYLDEAALVDFVLLNELFKNQDAFRASTFLSKGAGAKLQLGPIWDFDIAMGNSNYGESRALGGWLRGQAHATARAPARSPR